MKMVGLLVWKVLPEEFAAVWNASGSLTEASEAIRALACGPAPRWALMARAMELRLQGGELLQFAASKG